MKTKYKDAPEPNQNGEEEEGKRKSKEERRMSKVERRMSKVERRMSNERRGEEQIQSQRVRMLSYGAKLVHISMGGGRGRG